MDLWIRSQDRMNLVKVNQININYLNSKQIIANYIPDFVGTQGEYYETLGDYESKERALEVLDEIQNMLKPKLLVKINEFDEQEVHEKIRTNIFYEMPEE